MFSETRFSTSPHGGSSAGFFPLNIPPYLWLFSAAFFSGSLFSDCYCSVDENIRHRHFCVLGVQNIHYVTSWHWPDWLHWHFTLCSNKLDRLIQRTWVRFDVKPASDSQGFTPCWVCCCRCFLPSFVPPGSYIRVLELPLELLLHHT